jgi:hypothetical protein
MRLDMGWKEIRGRMQILMTRSWNGYLVRALNEFASLAAAFRDADPSHRIPALAKKASLDDQRRQKKSSGTPRRRKPNRTKCCLDSEHLIEVA